MVLGYSVMNAQIDAVTQEIDGKTYYIHTIEKGHTLYSLSKLYKVEVEDIVSNNPGVDKGLQIGQILRIPAASGTDGDRWENPIRLEGRFMIHKVKKGETLFGISKSYKVDVNDVLEHNAEANNGLRRNQELRIPTNDVDEVTLVEPDVADLPNTHLVQPGETLYSISKKYEVDIAELKDLNNGLPEGLKAGDRIQIPVFPDDSLEPVPHVDWKVELPEGSFDVSDFNIALMLPFYFHELDSTRLSTKHERLREVSLNFYRGASLALDTLKAMGLNASVFVLDGHGDKGNIESLIASPELKNSHLIIGPLQKTPLLKVSEYASRKGVHVVCPVPQSNKVLLNAANLSKVMSSEITQMQTMAATVSELHYLDNVILIKSLDTKDARLIQTFKTAYDKAQTSAVANPLVELPLQGKTVGDLKSKLSLVQRNVIIAPTHDKVIIQDLLTKAGLTDDEKFEIVIYGLEEWLGYHFIDVDYRERFSIRIPTSSYVDFNSPVVQSFEGQFQEQFETASDEYARIGYDVMLYYGMGLLDFGMNFPNRFADMSQEGLLNVGFSYTKTGMESGFENKHVFMLEHHNYGLQPIGPSFGFGENGE